MRLTAITGLTICFYGALRMMRTIVDAIEIHTALALVGAGMGIALVGASLAINNRSDVAFRHVDNLHCDSTLVALTRRDEDCLLAEAFLEILLNEGLRP